MHARSCFSAWCGFSHISLMEMFYHNTFHSFSHDNYFGFIFMARNLLFLRLLLYFLCYHSHHQRPSFINLYELIGTFHSTRLCKLIMRFKPGVNRRVLALQCFSCLCPICKCAAALCKLRTRYTREVYSFAFPV